MGGRVRWSVTSAHAATAACAATGRCGTAEAARRGCGEDRDPAEHLLGGTARAERISFAHPAEQLEEVPAAPALILVQRHEESVRGRHVDMIDSAATSGEMEGMALDLLRPVASSREEHRFQFTCGINPKTVAGAPEPL